MSTVLNKNIDAIEKQIQELEAKKIALIEEKKAFDALPVRNKFAIYLHDKFCRSNHNDGCSWYYEFVNKEHDWQAYSHKEYLTHADNVMNFLDSLKGK